MSYKKALKEAQEYDASLTAYSFGGRLVEIVLEDGSVFRWANAFSIEKDGYLRVFTEHYGYHVFDMDEVKSVLKFTKD